VTSWIQPYIQPSSTLPPFASIQSNVPVASPSIISCGTVPFSRKRNHKRRRAVHRSPRPTAPRRSTYGNCRSGSAPQARKAATFINESGVTLERPVSEPKCAKLVGGTTPRLIAHVLPEIKSPFNLQTWCECLRTHSDADFVTD